MCFDPLDGSSNIDCLVSIGTIFAIYRKVNCVYVIKQLLQFNPFECLKTKTNVMYLCKLKSVLASFITKPGLWLRVTRGDCYIFRKQELQTRDDLYHLHQQLWLSELIVK